MQFSKSDTVRAPLIIRHESCEVKLLQFKHRERADMPGAVEVEPIQYEVDGHVARIWLNRPHKRNSVSQQLLQELDEARIRAEQDDDVRVMVIRGREGTFCSGFDLDELQGDFVGTTGGYEIAQRS